MIALLVRLVPFVFFPFECFAAAATASALRVGEPVEGTLAFGTAQSYALALHAGDYVEATLEEHGSSGQILVLAPNGSRSRKFNMDGAKRKFAFVADADGPHTIQLRTEVNSGRAGEKAGTFGLRIDRVLPLSERMRLGTGRTPYAVPEIAALQRELPSPGATERFWRHVAEVGTPLVTPIADDEAHQLATFLWRGDSTTQNVVVIGPSDRPITDYLMDHIPDTDVWRLTLKLPAGARFAYTLSINDPLVLEGPRAAERAATQQADPLNPKKSWNYAPGAGIHEYSSMAELPGAPSQPWILKRPGVPEGKVEHMPFKSDLLGNERKITVYTPAGYQKGGGPFDLLVLFDENAYIDRVPTPTILDNLIASGSIRPMVAVLIANPNQETRVKELAPNPTFADFLANELIPWVHTRYRVTAEPSRTVVAGSSFGGIAATYAALRHPEIFGNVLCQSGSFWWAPDHRYGGDPLTETNWLAKQFIASSKLPIRFYMDAGLFEVDFSGSGGGILEPSRQMRDVLLAKGYEVHYKEFASGHDYLNWRGTLADGLMMLTGVTQSAKR
ncbi:enterochelin esterase [Methylosinus sp. RM1]|uniref:enterochelin esterase n=1 Tax=Methylosinus sp. RM1 TaxID=2583817 RepID=UPI0014082CEC|nr:enterochelin esterase [Methylosinus sp. RM1]